MYNFVRIPSWDWTHKWAEIKTSFQLDSARCYLLSLPISLSVKICYSRQLSIRVEQAKSVVYFSSLIICAFIFEDT